MQKINSNCQKSHGLSSLINPSAQGEPIFILTATHLQAMINHAFQPYEARLADLEAEVSDLKEIDEVFHGYIPSREDFESYKIAYGRRRDHLLKVECLVDDYLDPDSEFSLVTAIDGIRAERAQRAGRHRESRIKRLTEILKSHGGSASYALLKRNLSLDAASFSRLIGSLDKRKFEIIKDPRNKRKRLLKLR